MKALTIFTPTYNRAYCLNQVYQSLISQSNPDFIWLIIDDGSTDNTKELVNSWISENNIEIQYHYQENQGMHGAHNTAYKLIKTELNVCIDSDDFMPDDAVDQIIKFWSESDKYKNIAGFIGLDSFKDGKIIGSKFPTHLKKTTVEDLYHKHGIGGDKKLVLRTEVVKLFNQYPLFPNEKFVPLGTLYLLIDKEYEFLCLNKVLCVVEYIEDGSSKNIIKQYYKHPKGFRYSRMLTMKYSKYFKVKFKSAIHYVSHCIQLKDIGFLMKTPKFWLTVLAIPFGVVLFLYVSFVNKFKL
tara:strand:+ start:99 stop:989 length:891 start_codon:yes stop_codon:yes gene_type:complete